ncbi:uncharacterized protein LOC114356396 [Ostrinia furnacalis]|uniref:uncharacterized protein LOC114356396 n=1 Tax=Ostrinia furnacalis TaxID=93504 RepID=UPI001040D09E|nr:uncharacterized protein LOC114356396 [Ostrinia furnacalis]
MECNTNHPGDPRSNISKFTGYHPDKYAITDVSLTVKTDEGLTPGRPPCLTQRTIGKYLQPLTRQLVETPPFPTIDEMPNTVIDQMVKKDKAFWVDKPGANAYTLHDAYYNYGMTTEMVKPISQKAVGPHCRDCSDMKVPGLTPFQLAWAQDPGQKRWRYYPDLTATLTTEEIRKSMDEVGRPFQNEACNWYNENYPSVKYDCIMRKFSK